MSYRVLIVEDVVVQAKAMKAHLERDGHSVVHCTTASDALALLKSETFDIVLSDLALPDMDGLEIFRRLDDTAPSEMPPFIILTAYGTIERAREALRMGAYDFMTKPIDPTELSEAIRQAVEQRREERTSFSPLTLLVDPGSASREELAELLSELSKLFQMMGGSGVDFTVADARQPAAELVS